MWFLKMYLIGAFLKGKTYQPEGAIFFRLLQFEKLWQFYTALLICFVHCVLLQIFFFYRCMFFTLQKKRRGGEKHFTEKKVEKF